MEQNPRAFEAPMAARRLAELTVLGLSVSIDRRAVVSDVSLSVSEGEIVALLGRDGAGKTTCFEAIAGLARVEAGQVLLNGCDLTNCPIDRRSALGLAYLSEESSVFSGLTVEENILAVLEVAEHSPAVRSSRLEQLLTDFKLLPVRKQPATSVSGGERRRCEVARAMALDPRILLLDEPFRGLDPMSIVSTKRLMAHLRSHDVGVLVSDYDLHDLIDLIDRAYVLHEGRLVFAGNKEDLLSDPLVRHLYLGDGYSL
jgi:lipopolysaccharide export system ATP-binding protein